MKVDLRTPGAEIPVDLSRTRSEEARETVRRTLDEMGIRWREHCRFWTGFEAGTAEDAPERTLVVADLAEIVDAFRETTPHDWVAGVRRTRPLFLALWPEGSDRRAARSLDVLLEHSEQQLVVCGLEEAGELRAGLERAARAMHPHSLREVRLCAPEDGVWIRFADGLAGVVRWQEMHVVDERANLIVDSAIVGSGGGSLELLRQSGDLFEVDATALRALIDPEVAADLRASARRSDEAVGHRVREARRARALTQTELGRRAGLDQAVVSRLERGRHRPRIDTLRRIARGLDLTVSELLAG